MSYAYIASPYTSPSDAVRHKRHEWTELYVVDRFRHLDWVYSPICHCHDMAQRYELPKHFDFWMSYNYAMLHRASELRVLQIPGWKESIGVKAEIEFARANNIPIIFIPFEDIRKLRVTLPNV